MRVVSRLSAGVSGGRIVGSRCASIDLPVPGTADHQHVMAAGRRDHQRPLGELLAAHVGEIDVVGVELGEQLLDAGDHRLGRQLAGQDADRLGQGADAEDLRPP